MRRSAVLALLVVGVVALAGLPGRAESSVTYVGGGAAVVKSAGEPAVVDDGVVVCNPDGAPSIGGGCLPFGGSVQVTDAVLGNAVAFQVCIDNNGDGICGGGDAAGGTACADDLFFSHDDKGRFFNPLGPLPTTFARGCSGGAHSGYVIFLCDAVHNAEGGHAHKPTTGSITTTSAPGTGFGDFCAPHPGQPGPGKRYSVAS
jgi:hypothetical protein